MGSGFTTGGSVPSDAGSAGRGSDGGTYVRDKMGAEVESERRAARIPDAPAPAAASPSAAGAPALTPGRTPGVAYRPDGTRTFLPGNQVGLRHGAFSRHVIPEADEFAALILESMVHLTPADTAAVRDYAICQVRAWRLAASVEASGEFGPDGEPVPALKRLGEWMGRAEKARARLGLDPTSRAALAVDELTARRHHTALEREQVAEGRRLREAAEARGDLDPDDDGGDS